MNTCIDTDGFLSLKTFSSEKMFYGLSFYSPTQKSIQNVDFRKTSKYNNFITLPATLQAMFEANDFVEEKVLEKIYKDLLTKIPQLTGLKDQQLRNLEFDRCHRVRLEFFCVTKNMQNDIYFPYLPLEKMINKIIRRKLNDTMTNQIKCVLYPLKKLSRFLVLQKFRAIDVQNMFRNISSDQKTTLMYALEKAIDSLEILKNPKGGVLNQIALELKKDVFKNHDKNVCSGIPCYFVAKVEPTKDQLFSLLNPNILSNNQTTENQRGSENSNNNNDIIYDIPPANFDDISATSRNMNSSNNYYCIKSAVYHVHQIDDLEKPLTNEDMTKVPKNYQNFIGALSGISSLPKVEIHLRIRMKQAYFEFTKIPENEEADSTRPIPIIFPSPEYRMDFIRKKNITEINNFLDLLIRFIYLAYDASWVGIFKNMYASRKRKDPSYKTNATIDIDNIPRTKYEYDSTWGRDPLIDEDNSESGITKLITAPLDKAYENSRPTVTTYEHLIKHCFGTVDSNVSNHWNSMPAVRIYNDTRNFISSVATYFTTNRQDYPLDRLLKWNLDHFHKRLFSKMKRLQHRSDKLNDDSHCIV